MRTYFDCVQCFVRQALDAARHLTDDEKIQEQVLRGVLSQSSEMDFYKSPPEKGQSIHRMIRELLHDDNPYREIKDHSNRFALKLMPELHELIGNSADPFETAVRYAIAGNIIDFGASSHVDESIVRNTLGEAVHKPLYPCGIGMFSEAVENASDILYLGDNAGEIVFDRVLVEQLPAEKVTFVVRGRPVLNDVTLEDARFVGMADLVEVIDNGSDAPGTLLDDCSEYFLTRFEKADLIISKGQGNYESLSESTKNIMYVLMAKCSVVAQDIGCDVGSFILLDNSAKEHVAEDRDTLVKTT